MFLVIFICLVPKTGTRLVKLCVLVAMHERENRTTPNHGIPMSSLLIDLVYALVSEISHTLLRILHSFWRSEAAYWTLHEVSPPTLENIWGKTL